MNQGEDRAFFGHPKGLGWLLGAEAGWAFAFYGFQIMLTLYMTQTLLKPGHVEHVIGFAAYRGALEHVFGPLTPLGLASQTFGIATGLIYALPILGGLIADRWIGQRRAATAGVMVLVVAHALLIPERTFLVSMALMVVGTGLLKTNLVSQLGRLYAPDDDRRTRGFGLYLIALNTGSFLTPLIAGTIGERLGWATGFSVMALGMGLGALCYTVGLRHLPADPPRIRRGEASAASKLRPGDGRIIGVLLLLIALDGLYTGVYNQAFNVFPVWAEAHVERHVLGFLMPVTWFNTLDGVFTIAGTAVAVRVWSRRAKGGDTADIRRISIGFVMATMAYLVLAAATAMAGRGKAPLAPEALFFLLIDFAIPWIDTVILTLISRDAPASLASTILGIYYLGAAAGNFLTGWLGAFAERMTMPAFWLMHAAIAGAALLFLILTGFKLTRLLRPSQAAADGLLAEEPSAA